MIAEQVSSTSTATGTRHPMPGGETGVWVFIFSDLTLFAYMFGVFLVYRSNHLVIYGESRSMLNQDFGAANTLVLLLSSLVVVFGLRAQRARRSADARRWFGAGILFGFAFTVLKVAEYHHEISLGNTITTNSFFTFYYLLTGLHLAHLLIGMVLLILVRRASGELELSSGRQILVDGGTCYWHMVDLLWLLIFPLLYLMR